MRKRQPLPKKIAVIHLKPLPLSPAMLGASASDCVEWAGQAALKEARVFEKSGFDGVILENFGDAPFYKSQVPTATVAAMALIASAVKASVKIPVGINVLRNDSLAALSIAATTGCDFMRVNVISGVFATDQGLIEGNAAELIRLREKLGGGIKILADVHVKHGKSLSSQSLEDAIEEAILRARADGIIVSGGGTGKETNPDDIERAARISKKLKVPMYVGSGVTVKSLGLIKRLGAGIIVSSALRKSGRAGEALDPKRLKEFRAGLKK